MMWTPLPSGTTILLSVSGSLFLAFYLLIEPLQLQSGDNTTLSECFLATNYCIYRLQLSFNKPLEYFISSIQKSNHLAIKKTIPAKWFSKNKQKISLTMVCVNGQSIKGLYQLI